MVYYCFKTYVGKWVGILDRLLDDMFNSNISEKTSCRYNRFVVFISEVTLLWKPLTNIFATAIQQHVSIINVPKTYHHSPMILTGQRRMKNRASWIRDNGIVMMSVSLRKSNNNSVSKFQTEHRLSQIQLRCCLFFMGCLADSVDHTAGVSSTAKYWCAGNPTGSSPVSSLTFDNLVRVWRFPWWNALTSSLSFLWQTISNFKPQRKRWQKPCVLHPNSDSTAILIWQQGYWSLRVMEWSQSQGREVNPRRFQEDYRCWRYGAKALTEIGLSVTVFFLFFFCVALTHWNRMTAIFLYQGHR